MADAPARLEIESVVGAAGSLVARTLGAVAAGIFLGVIAFSVLALFDVWPDAGWGRGVAWALVLPLYLVGGAAALGAIAAIRGVRAAAVRLLVDSGVIRRMVERGLARVRKADEAPEPAEVKPRGWLGTRVHGLGQAISRTLVERLRSTAAPENETAATVDQAAGMMIDEWSEIPEYIAFASLALIFVGSPILLAWVT